MRVVILLFLILPFSARATQNVEVCFALDTTGSMSGLIETAKQKVWYIANEIANAPSRPNVRFCLMAYRDRGDDYVTRHTDLTDDLDLIYDTLMEYQAAGGGDHPESVNQALHETVQDTTWSPSPHTLKLIFLVGDAPPHTDYDEPQFEEIAANAKSRGIIINPVLCGADQSTDDIWDQIAQRASGVRVTLRDPSGASREVSTPMDQDLAVLAPRLESTTIPYGPSQVAEAFNQRMQRNRDMGESVAADRISYKATAKDWVADTDLIEALQTGKLNMDELNAEWLPPAVRSMTPEELSAHLGEVRMERTQLKKVIDALVAERRDYLAERRDKDGFDSKVSELVIRQLSEDG